MLNLECTERPEIPSSDPSELICSDAAPGGHPKLVRLPDGRLYLIYRNSAGMVERRHVYVFENAVIS